MYPHAIPPVESFNHSTDIQIRFSDVDVLGHVNNTIYFNYYDTGKSQFFSDILDRPIEWRKVETVIANVDCCYVAPIFYGEDIAVLTKCETVSDRSFKLMQVIWEKKKGVVKSACETVMVAFDPATQQGAEMPDHWRNALLASMNNDK